MQIMIRCCYIICRFLQFFLCRNLGHKLKFTSTCPSDWKNDSRFFSLKYCVQSMLSRGYVLLVCLSSWSLQRQLLLYFSQNGWRKESRFLASSIVCSQCLAEVICFSSLLKLESTNTAPPLLFPEWLAIKEGHFSFF